MTLKEAMKSIKPASQALRQQAKQRWDQVAKPLGSLGVLEEDIIRIAAASGSLAVSLRPRAIVVMCGDNGVVKEGVTQTGQEVTAIVAGNMARGNSCVCLMARQAGADVIPVDVGMACRDAVPGVVNRKVAYGTKDFLEEPAMTREETVKAMEAGADMAVELKERGYVLAGSGEMGIGNTTTSSALLSVLLNMDPELVTGRGAGLTTAGYNRKVQVIREGIRIRKPSGRGSGGRAVQSGRTGFSGSDRILHRMRGLRPAGGAGRTHNRGSSSGSCQNQPGCKRISAGLPRFSRACRGNGSGCSWP